MPCPSCQAFTGPNDKFCSKCGTQLEELKQQFSEIVEEGEEVVDTCPNCNAGVTADQLYCTICGTPLAGSADLEGADEGD